MSKYMFIYRGPALPLDQVTAAESAAQLAEWLAWETHVGPILIDDGAPFGDRASVRDDGFPAETAELQGYGIIAADSLSAAVALAQKHPFLNGRDGRHSVDVFEIVDLDV